MRAGGAPCRAPERFASASCCRFCLRPSARTRLRGRGQAPPPVRQGRCVPWRRAFTSGCRGATRSGMTGLSRSRRPSLPRRARPFYVGRRSRPPDLSRRRRFVAGARDGRRRAAGLGRSQLLRAHAGSDGHRAPTPEPTIRRLEGQRDRPATPVIAISEPEPPQGRRSRFARASTGALLLTVPRR